MTPVSMVAGMLPFALGLTLRSRMAAWVLAAGTRSDDLESGLAPARAHPSTPRAWPLA